MAHAAIKGRRKGALPDAGFRRDEEKKLRAADLEELADKANSEVDGAVGSRALKDLPIDNEIAQHFQRDPDTNELGLGIWVQPGYVYTMVSEKYPTNAPGIKIQEKELQIPGMEVVQAGMPESDHPKNKRKRDARGYIIVGDSVLMRCRKDLYMKWFLRDRAERRERDEYAPDDGLGVAIDAGERMGIAKSISLDDPRVQRALNRAVASDIASKNFVQQLKNGVVPGLDLQS